LRCASEDELFPQICHDAVRFGQMQMAWIGIISSDSQQIISVASFGKGADFLNDMHLSIDVKSPFGQGPIGNAIRNDRPVWCQDFLNDPSTDPLHERAADFGWRSSASLPLHRNGLVTGSFNVYADVTDAFDETEQNLLLEMAMDISYAIDRFEKDRQRQALTEELQKTRTKMDSILANIDQVIWSVDAATHQVLFLNSAAETIYGRTVDEFFNVPQLWLKAVHPDDMDIALEMDKQVRAVGSAATEIRIIRPNGDVRWIHNQAWSVSDDHGKVVRLDGVVSDITERKEAESHIQHLAYYDVLTGLPNRTLLYDRVSQAINLAVRNHTQMVLIFLDLDHFKNINDTLGHRIGDQLLNKAAQRMKSTVREEDTVARPGGDEFILTLIDTDNDGAAHVAEKILAAMSQPFKIDEHELVVTASIGIAVYPNDGKDFHVLAQCADAAMYRAKQEGRNCYRFFSVEMQANSARVLLLQNALHRALELEQLHIQYQPQFSLQSGEIIGIEALVRWQHPELGLVSPAEFIPIAENCGQIMAIGEWVLRTALGQLKCWLDSGMTDMPIAVNLSAVQFNHARLPELIVQILEEVQLPPHALVLELTESVSMDNPLAAIAIMDKLHDRGVRMSIDDFGTGYSSLSYLKRFQVYKLKIDQSFVRNITDDSQDRAIVTAIINLSRSFGLQTIAEGVETEGQLAFLREQGCDEAQGYFFTEPLSAEQLLVFVRNHISSAGGSA
jgi:diguanylate cyclase (GGDEF)-like protein/PAS domain S-box-containing protein